MSVIEELNGVPLRQRRHNMGLVLGVLLVASEPATVSELMEDTGLSRQSVHALCDDLIGLGLVVETEPIAPRSPTGVGRRSRAFALDASAGYVAGVELGPELIVAQLCDLRGDIVASTTMESPDPFRPVTELVEDAKRIVDELIAEAGVDSGLVTTLAVGVPAPVDPKGVAGRATRVPGLAGTNVVEAFSSGRTWKVLVDNDANFAAVGERWRGIAQGVDSVVLLLVEERLGAGILDSGRIIRGGNGYSGQLDFVKLLEGGRGTRGILTLIEQHLEHLSDADRTRLSSAKLSDETTTTPMRGRRVRVANAVFEAALSGDPVATTIVEAVADRLARVTAVVATLFNPDMIVYGCDVPLDAEALLEPIRRRLAPLMQSNPPKLVRSTLQDQAVASGAVRAALDFAHQRLLP